MPESMAFLIGTLAPWNCESQQSCSSFPFGEALQVIERRGHEYGK